jgi:hypothetical protein
LVAPPLDGEYYAYGMKATGLPARIIYATLALPLSVAAGFYSCMYLLPRLMTRYPQIDPGDGRGIFNLSLGIGAAVAFMAALYMLTLPWSRHRKRRGRPWRIAASVVLVIAASAWFSDMGHRLPLDLLFAAWLAYTMAFTFVRYGVLDRSKRSRSSARSN